MGRDGFTGIDRDRAEEDIHNFDYEAICVLCSLNNKFGGFLEFLSQNWASPNAETYTKQLGNDMHDILHEYDVKEYNFVKGAYNVANKLLLANGEVPLGELYDTSYNETNYATCGLELDNKTGMDTGAVTTGLSEFNHLLKRGIAEFDDLPEEIAFYDQDGELIEVYNSGIKDFKVEIQSLLFDIMKNMNANIEEEAYVIFTSKKEAADDIPSNTKLA